MKLLRRALLLLLAGLVFFFGAGVFATWAPDLPPERLAQRWAGGASRFVDVAGMRVHLRDEGPRDDPMPIVLLHGTADSLHTWNGWAGVLQPHRRVIRFDLPGFGLTGPHPAGDYTIAAYVQFVRAMLAHLQLDACVLGGNSLGGEIAWATALAAPDTVRRLVLVDASGYREVSSQQLPLALSLATHPLASRVLEHVLPRGLVLSTLRSLYGDPARVTPELVDRYYDMALREGNRRALAQRLRIAGAAYDAPRQPVPDVPTLVIWGGKDTLLPLSTGQAIAQEIRGAQLVVFDTLGHLPQQEDPAATAQAVQRFLGGLASSQRD